MMHHHMQVSLVFLMVLAMGGLPDGYAAGYRLTVSYETSAKSSDGDTSSSNGRSIYSVKRVVTPTGEEVIYDLPADSTPEERAREWLLPATVVHGSDGSIRLLDETALEKRRDAWLRTGKLDKSACGRWIFTWAAFKIECAPRSALALIEAIDRPFGAIAPGSTVAHPLALGVGRVERVDATHLAATIPVDPDAVRRTRAETDIVVAEISGQPITPETASERHRAEKIDGTVRIVFEVDTTGVFIKRTTELRQRIIEADGRIDEERRTETVERYPLR